MLLDTSTFNNNQVCKCPTDLEQGRPALVPESIALELAMARPLGCLRKPAHSEMGPEDVPDRLSTASSPFRPTPEMSCRQGQRFCTLPTPEHSDYGCTLESSAKILKHRFPSPTSRDSNLIGLGWGSHSDPRCSQGGGSPLEVPSEHGTDLRPGRGTGLAPELVNGALERRLRRG